MGVFGGTLLTRAAVCGLYCHCAVNSVQQLRALLVSTLFFHVKVFRLLLILSLRYILNKCSSLPYLFMAYNKNKTKIKTKTDTTVNPY